MCCIWVGYKKCDLKNTEGMARGSKTKCRGFLLFLLKTAFCFEGIGVELS